MGGKASILMVLGFSVIFLVVGYNYTQMIGRVVDNNASYYERTMAHAIAVSGANMAANRIFLSKVWDTGYNDVPFGGGSFDVEIDTLGVYKYIRSAGTYQSVVESVVIQLQPSYFSKFGNFYETISAYPATGDTFNGPFHTNNVLTTYGTPVFWGKTTSKNGLNLQGWPKDPKFYGGYDSGIDIPLEFDTTGMRQDSDDHGKVFRDTLGLGRPLDVQLYFNSDGTVTHSFSINDGLGLWTPPETTPLTTLTPGGMIYVERGNIYTKGTVNGAATIVATKKGAAGKGEIWQQDDLQYNDDPRLNPASRDILGMVAEEDIRLEYNANTVNQDIITQASMFSLNGNIGPETALVDNPNLQSWRILGGLIAEDTRVTARYKWIVDGYYPYKGYKFVHDYDERFMSYVPPNFPHTRHYEIVSWYE